MSNEDPWSVRLAAPAIRDLDRIPHRYATAIVEFVTGVLPSNQARLGKPLRGKLEGLHSARRGDYRVLYRIDHAQQAVYVIRIDHRRHAYRVN